MLLSFHTFAKGNVDVAIYETYSGGESDSTNILQPLITGITTIGMDHIRVLGPSVRNVAWHKAGIFKKGSVAFSSQQQPDVADMLQIRAEEKSVSLTFIDINPTPSYQGPEARYTED